MAHRARSAGSAALPGELQRWLLLALLPAAVLAFSRGVHDAFELPKFLLIITAICLVAALALVRAVRRGDIVFPRHPSVFAALAFAGAVVITTAASYAPVLSFLGEYRRFQGAVSYLLYVAAFVLMVRLLGLHDVRRLALMIAGAAGLVGAYALVQVAGLDPFTWGGAVSEGAISTLGNPNFASGWLGIAVPLVAWSFQAQTSARWRAGFGLAGLLALGGIIASGALQGYIAAAAGLGVLAAGWLLNRGGRWFRIGLPALGVGAAAGVGVIAMSFATAAGPLGFIGAQVGSVLRKVYWRTAVTMFAEHPLTGVGLDRYGGYFFEYRPDAAVRLLGLQFNVDEAHSVPLAMFAEGGILLGLAYLAFVVLVGSALIQGLRRWDGDRRLLLAAVGGAWLAYQVQSVVSIDVPVLALSHWLLAGAVLVVAESAELVPIRVPGLESKERRRGKTRAGMVRRREIAGRFATALAVLSIVGLVVFASVLLRADAALKSALLAERAGVDGIAAENASRTVELMPWWPKYWIDASRIVETARGVEAGISMLREAIARDPRHLHAHVNLGRAYSRADERDAAVEVYEEVVRLDPLTPRYQAEYGEALLLAGRPTEALPRLQDAVAMEPVPQYWLVLGRAYEQLGRTTEAVEAYEQVLATAGGNTPQNLLDEALEKLAELST